MERCIWCLQTNAVVVSLQRTGNDSSVLGTVCSGGRGQLLSPPWGHSQLLLTSQFVNWNPNLVRLSAPDVNYCSAMPDGLDEGSSGESTLC